MSKQSHLQTLRVLRDHLAGRDGVYLRVDRDDVGSRQQRVSILVGSVGFSAEPAKVVGEITSEIMETLGPVFQAIFAKKLAERLAKAEPLALAEFDAQVVADIKKTADQRAAMFPHAPPLAALSTGVVGTEEGQTCGRDGCTGELIIPRSENCSCHISAPCPSCTSVVLTCSACGWSEHDDAG